MEAQKSPPHKDKAIRSRNAGSNTILPQCFHIVLQSQSNKTARQWLQTRAVDQQNRVEDPETKPHSSSHTILDKGVKNIHGRGGKAASSTNDAGKIGFPHVGERTRSLSLTLHKVTMKMLALPIYTLKMIKTGYYSLQLNWARVKL